MVRLALPLALSGLAACGPGPSPLLDLEADETWSLGLDADAYVVTTPMGVPHVYAADREDLGKVVGFQLARDRFFYMDVASRLALGEVSALLGDAALEQDIEQRMFAATWIADRVLGLLEDDAEMAAYFDGIAAGVNAYQDAVRAGDLAAPSEYELAAPLLGVEPVDLLVPWDRRRVVGGLVTVLYQTGFETKDVGRTRDAQRYGTVFDGAPLGDLRQAGLDDSWGSVLPPKIVAQSPDWVGGGSSRRAPRRRSHATSVNPEALDRLFEHTQRMEARLGHDWISGFGSNAWVVSGDKSADGRALVATDGHLPLSVPPLFYQIGIDTTELGDRDAGVHQVGMMTPAMPLISSGTNGDIAFGQTQLIGDITDWYVERITLDDDGAPAASAWKDGTEPLVAVEETIEVGDSPSPFGSGAEPFLFTFTRYTTFDGRWITSIEGREVDGPEDAADGETAVHIMGSWIIPEDDDDDGHITATSFDYAGLDLSNMARVIDDYGRADGVDTFAEATENLVAYSLNLVVGDKDGRILYTGYQAVPCRGYLERDGSGVWIDGHDPNLLLNGWEVGGFTIPIADGYVDHGQGDDPYKCVIPWEDYPHSFDPDQGFLVSANNDPGGFTFDDDLTNDPVYIGGPWMEGYRAEELTRQLDGIVPEGATLDDMKTLQGNHTSVLGLDLAPVLLEAIADARDLAAGSPAADTSDARIADLWDANEARIEEVEDRFLAWIDRGTQAESGVETFYESPTEDERADAVATMIFNAWMGRYTDHTVDDEGIPGLGFPTGDTGRFRVLARMLASRGPDGDVYPEWNPDTEESVYFDIKGTPEVETSTEVAILALVDALDFLEGEPVEAGVGGFGTDDMDQWLWGMRHTVTMTSLLGSFFGLDPEQFGTIIEPFNISPNTFPVAPDLKLGDPRCNLPGFPRHADNLCVDAANSGTNGTTFDNDYGAVWRLVVALGPEADGGFEAYNVIPGGQSGILDSPHFADQAKLWLGNEYLPVQLDVDDVIEARTGVTLFPAAE